MAHEVLEFAYILLELGRYWECRIIHERKVGSTNWVMVQAFAQYTHTYWLQASH